MEFLKLKMGFFSPFHVELRSGVYKKKLNSCFFWLSEYQNKLLILNYN